MRLSICLKLGALMAVTAIGTEPLSLLAVPDPAFSPANLMPYGTAPSGGVAADGTTAPQTDFEVETEPGSGNVRDINGLPGAILKGGGSPTSELTLTATTAIPGVPGTTARYTYTDADGVTFGASEPVVLTAFETVFATGVDDRRPRMVATPDGVVHTVFENVDDGYPRYTNRSATTETWTTPVNAWGSGVEALATTGSGGYLIDPCIWWVRSDTSSGYVLFIASWWATSSSSQTLRISQSTDKGATWKKWDSDLVVAYSATLQYTQLQIVWDALSEQLTLAVIRNTAGTYSGRVYISNDLTASRWESLAGAAISDARQIALATYCGQVYLASLVNGNAATVRRRDATAIDWETQTTDTGVDFEVACGIILVPNDAGWLYLVGRDDTDHSKLVMQVSVNDATTWGAPSGAYPYQDSLGTTILDDDVDGATTTLVDGAALVTGCWTGETLILGGTLKTTAGVLDNSIVSLRFGGISNITLAAPNAGTDAAYYPTSIPETKSPQWVSFSTSGSTAQNITTDSGGRLVYTLSSDNSTGFDQYDLVGTPSVAAAIWSLGPSTSGGSSTQFHIALQIETKDDGSANRSNLTLMVNWTGATIQGYDTVLGANVGSAGAFDNTKPLTVIVALDGEESRGAVYFRQTGDTSWSNLFSNQAMATTATGSPETWITIGKIQASTAAVHTLFFIPFGSASAGFVADVAAGNFPTALVPIRAVPASQQGAQRLPQGAFASWVGSPLYAGDTQTLRTISQRPLALTSAQSATPSPSRAYVGPTGASGSTYRTAYDHGSGVERRTAHGLAFVAAFNAGPLAALRYRRWDGAAWQTDFSAVGYANPFGADGAVGFRRTSAASMIFAPNDANGTPAYNELDGWVDRWVQFGDGTNTILGKVSMVHPGQFTNAIGALQSAIELDPDSIVTVAGVKANLSTATTTGNFRLYYDDLIVIGALSTIDSVRYTALEWTLAPGATVPRGGLITAGAAYALACTTRDGSSMRTIAKDEIVQIPGTGIVQGQNVRRRIQRVFELPYDTILTQPGMYTSGTLINGISISSTTSRALVDTNLSTIRGVQRRAGQTVPTILVLGAQFSQDPASGGLAFGNDQISLGTIGREFDETMARGLLRDLGRHAQSGGILQHSELI